VPANLRPPGVGLYRTPDGCPPSARNHESPLGSAPAVAHALLRCIQGMPAWSLRVGMLCAVYGGKAPPCLGAPVPADGISKASRRMEGWATGWRYNWKCWKPVLVPDSYSRCHPRPCPVWTLSRVDPD